MLKIGIKLDTAQAQELLERAPTVFHAALEQALDWSLLTLERAVKLNIASPLGDKLPAVAFTTLVRAVFSEPKERPEIGGIVAVHPPADVYAPAVEYGTRAHFPPPEALYGWVKLKFGLTEDNAVKTAAFLVARAISKRGTKGHFMFTRAFDENREAVVARFNSEVSAAIEKLNRGEIPAL